MRSLPVMARPSSRRAAAGRVSELRTGAPLSSSGRLARIGVSAFAALATLLVLPIPASTAAGPPARSSAGPSPRLSTLHTSRDVLPGTTTGPGSGSLRSKHAPRTPLERQTGLSMTIDSVTPTALERGSDLEVSGIVTDDGNKTWRDAQVYLDIRYDPATTRQQLFDFRAEAAGGFGTPVIDYGHFDEIGRLTPKSVSSYSLSIPFSKLPISQAPGVYHVGVIVIAGARDGTRTTVARQDTLVPLLPDQANGSPPLEKTGVVTLVPFAATVPRISQGSFSDDSLASLVTYGGQLRNLLDFVSSAPPNTIEIVLDPALHSALKDMANGYTVRTPADIAAHKPGEPGTGQADAQRWLSDFASAARRQDLLFMPWGSPEVSSLGSHRMTDVVQAAVRASQAYAARQRITTAVASWPYAGATTRRGLAVAAIADAPLRVVSQRSLTNLRQQDDGSYPPSQVLVPTSVGQTTALVTRTDIAGDELTRYTTGQQLLQDIVAETTVRSLDSEPPATSIVAVPFGWDPGLDTGADQIAAAYDFPTVQPRTAASAAQDTAVPYAGPIKMPFIVRPLGPDVLNAILQLRRRGRTFTDLLSDQDKAAPVFDETLASSGTSLWRADLATRVSMTDRTAEQAMNQTAKVRVSGPTFVALSSASGRFPLTVTNGLPVPVTVQVVAHAENPAVTIDPIPQLSLQPGQRRDIEATAHSTGSGLTGVRVRLVTTTHRPVGSPWTFDVRSTQIGTAIWVVMGIGAAILFGAAARRIYQRVREGRLHTREEPHL